MSEKKNTEAQIAPEKPTGTETKTVEPRVSTPKETIASTALKEVGKRLLKQYPRESMIHVTSDGTGFFAKDDAIRHANKLPDKIVITVKR